MASPALSLADATFAYRRATPAVHGLTAELPPGAALALIGPNGAGKSTLLKGILGLVPLTGGALTVLGSTDAASTRPSIGYVPQSGSLDPDFPVSARQVVMMGRYRRMGWFRWASPADRRAVDAALETVGLTRLARAPFGRLSGGQQQRILLARALVSEPRILLLDEPFNGLDATNRKALLATIDRLKSDGVAVVVSTHDLELARTSCEYSLLLHGEQIAFGPTPEVLSLDNLERVNAELVDPHDGH